MQAYQNEIQAEARAAQAAVVQQLQEKQAAESKTGGEEEPEWPSISDGEPQQQLQQQQQQQQVAQPQQQQQAEAGGWGAENSGWDTNPGWGQQASEEAVVESQAAPVTLEVTDAEDDGQGWANFGGGGAETAPTQDANNDNAGWAESTTVAADSNDNNGGDGGWTGASYTTPPTQQTLDPASAAEEPYPSAATSPMALGNTATATALYEFFPSGSDELQIAEGEVLTILLDECDEDGWVMALNAEGSRGLVPQNYVDFEQGVADGGQDPMTGGAGLERQDSILSGGDGSSIHRSDSYGNSNGNGQIVRQGSVTSQGSNGSWDGGVGGSNYYGGYGTMEPIPEQADEISSAPTMPPPVTDIEDSSDEEEEDDSSAGETESSMPPGLGPPPGKTQALQTLLILLKYYNQCLFFAGPPPMGPPPVPPPVTRGDSVESTSKMSRPPSISLSASLAEAKEFCKAVYDYNSTGRDEITFEEGDVIRILKKKPNGVDDGWYMGE